MIVFGFKIDETHLYLDTLPHLVTSWAYHLNFMTLAGLPSALFLYCMEAKRICASKSAYFDLDETISTYGSKASLVNTSQ